MQLTEVDNADFVGLGTGTGRHRCTTDVCRTRLGVHACASQQRNYRHVSLKARKSAEQDIAAVKRPQKSSDMFLALGFDEDDLTMLSAGQGLALADRAYAHLAS